MAGAAAGLVFASIASLDTPSVTGNVDMFVFGQLLEPNPSLTKNYQASIDLRVWLIHGINWLLAIWARDAHKFKQRNKDKNMKRSSINHKDQARVLVGSQKLGDLHSYSICGIEVLGSTTLLLDGIRGEQK